MRTLIIPAFALLMCLPASAQNRVNIKPGEKLEFQTNEPKTQVGRFYRDLLKLDEWRRDGMISLEEQTTTRDAMVKDLLKGLHEVEAGADLAELRDIGKHKLLSPAQVATVRKQILLVRFIRNTGKEEQD